jgi:hypothetical protein
MSIRFSQLANAAKFRAIAGIITAVELYDGVRPKTPDAAASKPLVRLSTAAAAIKATSAGFEITGMAVAKAERAGRASWYRCVNAEGKSVFDGIIATAGEAALQKSGHGEVPADMIMEDPQIWPGMEVEIQELAIRSKAVMA